MKLSSKVEVLKGVGPVVARGLALAGVETIEDLLRYFPRRWEDYSQVAKMNKITPGPVAVLGRIEAVNVRRSARMKRLTITEAVLSDGTGTIKAVWFNQPYLLNTLKKDEQYLFAGKFEFKNGYLSLNSPSFEPANEGNWKGKIYPIYPENSILTSKIIQKLVAQCIDLVDELDDELPEPIRKQNELVSISEALRALHQPVTMAQIEQAKHRLGFEELFWLVLTGLVLKSELQTEVSPQVPFDKYVVDELMELVSFDLTDGQRKAAWAILQDIERAVPMNRLLEGDVGSGKTLVAFIATAMAVRAGWQVALMVPTEILARQHAATASKILANMNIKCELLISALPKAEKTRVHEAITAGQVDVVIGTHALLAEGVEFNKLGLVIIDEQHRFGVGQRRQLKSKAEVMPHVLTMTATPIPRSLALIVYGDLDVSIIDELPPGRVPIQTKVARELDRSTVYFFVDQLLTQGQQAFVICPLIEESDKSGARSVEAEYRRLQKSVFSHRRVAQLHGRMKADEKEQIMNDFRAGKFDILLSTTVIEVGVDVPNATVLIVEDAERFGLAQLHQLRGRVGRGGLQSYCYLFTNSDSPESMKRLQALERTTDGFRLSQIDLQLRGPGEIYGTMQSGILDLRFADLFDTPLIAKVKNTAQAFLSGGEVLHYNSVVDKINSLKKLTSLD